MGTIVYAGLKVVDIVMRKLISVAENLGWKVELGEQEDGNGCIKKFAELEKYSPAGEDFFLTVFYEDASDFVHKVWEQYEAFDVDEHVEMWILARKRVEGVPKASVLVKDAEEIEKMIEELYDALNKKYQFMKTIME